MISEKKISFQSLISEKKIKLSNTKQNINNVYFIINFIEMMMMMIMKKKTKKKQKNVWLTTSGQRGEDVVN